MNTVDIDEAKTSLSKLVERVEAGEEVIFARGGKPVARLTQWVATKRKIRFGLLKNKVKIAKDFDAVLPAGVLVEFEAS